MKELSAKDWLRANGYEALADKIERIEGRWAAEGRKTRRNWWEVLAGTSDGASRTVAGVTFPVLPEARIRQGRSSVPSASAEEAAPALERPPDCSAVPEPLLQTGSLPQMSSIEKAIGILEAAANDGRLVPLLGAGASMSAPMRLPSWSSLVNKMADHVEPFQKPRAELIRDELRLGNLLSAAALYSKTDLVPKPERMKFFQTTFSVSPNTTNDAYKLVTTLPFRHCVTTNFDDGLRHAIMRMDNPSEFEEARNPNFSPLVATWSEKRFFVHLHGRIVDYDSLIYAEQHYEASRKNPYYREVLRRLFIDNTLLLFGFSFQDPNFTEILRFVADELGGNTGRTHVAILPEGFPRPQDTLLERANIFVLQYRPSSDAHDEAIATLKLVCRDVPRRTITAPTVLSRERSQELRDLSAIYLSILDPNRGSTYATACGAITVRALMNAKGRSLSKEELAMSVSSLAHASLADATSMVAEGVVQLGDRILVNDGRYRLGRTGLQDPPDKLEELLGAIETRIHTYDAHFKITGGTRRAIRYVVAYCMLVQGSTVARAFRNQEPADGYQLSVIAAESATQIDKLSRSQGELIARCVVEVLRDPDAGASRALFELAHAAYALECVFLNPTSSELADSLQWKMYLDSNVVMRVMSVVDPRHRQFDYILSRLRRMGTPLAMLFPFVEEIVDHATSVEGDLHRRRVRSHSDLQTYVGILPKEERSPLLLWYLAVVSRANWISFPEFRRQAHLSNASELSRILEGLGISIEGRDARREMDTAERETLWDYLKTWRGGQRSQPQRQLRRNEATQILWLVRLRRDGVRSWFLSMDSQLRQALKFSDDSRYSGFVMTPTEWAHRLASIHWGEVDVAGFAEMMWAIPEKTAVQRAQYEVLFEVARKVEEDGLAVAPDRIRDAVDDFFARGPLSASIRSAAAVGSEELEKLEADILPRTVEAILDGLASPRRR